MALIDQLDEFLHSGEDDSCWPVRLPDGDAIKTEAFSEQSTENASKRRRSSVGKRLSAAKKGFQEAKPSIKEEPYTPTKLWCPKMHASIPGYVQVKLAPDCASF